MITERQLQNYSRALSETENGKCTHTYIALEKVLKEKFGNSVDIFLQGSYKNSTNIKQDSDVDIVICYTDAYFPDLSMLTEQEKSQYKLSIVTHHYEFSQFKNDVEALMRTNFGAVERKNKCIFIHGNNYRVNADVVPCFVCKRFSSPYRVETEGVKLISDNGEDIISFPKQHYYNGVHKNKSTNRSFKSAVRVLKNVRNILIDDRIIDIKIMPSFFLECLVWNVLDTHFNEHSIKDTIIKIIEVLWSDMGNIEATNNYAEISDLMYLFRRQPTRTPENAKIFLKSAYNLINSQ